MSKNQLFIEACKNGDIVKAEKLLKKSLFSKPVDVNYCTGFGKTALMVAVENKQHQIVDFLIAKGVDVNFSMFYRGKTAIVLSIGNDKCNDQNTLDIVTSLIAAGADPNKTFEKEILLNEILNKDSKEDPDGIYQSISLQLIKGGADVDARTSKWGETPLHLASEKGYADVVKVLLEKKVDINARNLNGQTPLLLACYRGHAHIAEILINNGADVHLKNSDEKTPLIVAVPYCTPVVKLLIEKGANVNDRDKYLSSALTYSQNADIADLLLKNGADIDVRNHRGETPLIFATINKRKEVVAFLLASEANASCKDEEHKTAIDYASEDVLPLFLGH